MLSTTIFFTLQVGFSLSISQVSEYFHNYSRNKKLKVMLEGPFYHLTSNSAPNIINATSVPDCVLILPLSLYKWPLSFTRSIPVVSLMVCPHPFLHHSILFSILHLGWSFQGTDHFKNSSWINHSVYTTCCNDIYFCFLLTP